MRLVDVHTLGEIVDSHGNIHYEDILNTPTVDVQENIYRKCLHPCIIKDCPIKDSKNKEKIRMKYYVIEITKYNDGTKDAYGVYAKDSEVEAVALFHQKLAGAMKSEVVAFELCQVINDYGVVIKTEYYENTTPSEGE